MNRDVCGICWGAYDDAGRCECKPQSEPVGCPNCASLKAELEQRHLYQPVLTDEIIADLWYQNGTYYHHFARAIERYLTRK